MYKIETPVFLNTTFNYFCDGCEMCEPIIKKETLYVDSFIECEEKRVYILTCKNYGTCKGLMHNLRYVLKKTARAEDEE